MLNRPTLVPSGVSSGYLLANEGPRVHLGDYVDCGEDDPQSITYPDWKTMQKDGWLID